MPARSRLRLFCLPWTGQVLFPGGLARRELSPDEARAVTAGADRLLVVPTMDPAEAGALRPGGRRTARVATLCRVIERTPLEGGREGVVLEGLQRVGVVEVQEEQGLVSARVAAAPDRDSAQSVPAQVLLEVLERVQTLERLDSRAPRGLSRALGERLDDAERFVDEACSRLQLEAHHAIRLLAEWDPGRRVALLLDCVRRALEGAGSRQAVTDAEVRLLEAQLARTPVSFAARAKAHRELAHLRRAAPGSAEAGRIRNWLEWMLELPWATPAQDPDKSRIQSVAAELDQTHAGLGEVKKCVAEFVAVRQLRGKARGSALCFMGPAGTGKTSMARALARALGRKFVHVSAGSLGLGSELRGTNHTQPGAVPGRILQGLHRAGTSNPVILLDEIDKVSPDDDGTTASALQALLEPEENREFLDHYLGVPFDLSSCVFLTTASDPEAIPESLADRLEMIRFESYSEEDKLEVAREHLIPRTRESIGLNRWQFRITPGALRDIIKSYTEEAGVRQLQRVIDSLGRKAAVAVVQGRHGLFVRKSGLLDLLGPANVEEELLREPAVGMTMGLAWTSAGGSLLPIEALAMPGTGRTILTGSLGEVMRESVQTALSFVRSRFGAMGLAHDRLDSLDVHIHFPSGATPKDGPSAGIAIAAAMVSLLTGVPARHDVAMSGEMSLTGAVLPVGALRDKILAALRAGIREVIVPERNREEVLRLPVEVRRELMIHLVDRTEDALAHALVLRGRVRLRLALDATRRRRIARRAQGKKRKRRSA